MRIRTLLIIPLLLTTPLSAQVAFEGDNQGIRWVLELIERTRSVSPEFNTLYQELSDLSDQRFSGWLRPSVRVTEANHRSVFGDPAAERNQLYLLGEGPMLGMAASPLAKAEIEMFSDDGMEVSGDIEAQVRITISGHALVLDLFDLRQLPTFSKNGEQWILSDGAPDWAVSAESVIAHELSEYYDGLVHGFCSYSCECVDNRDNHIVGKRMENHVRAAFGQTGLRNHADHCGDAQEPVIEIGTHRVKLEVDESGRLLEISYE